MLIRDTNIKVDRDRCIACGICVERCILDNLRLSVAPCRQSCPLQLNCQAMIRLIALGNAELAVDSIQEFMPFIGLLGLLCHAPCQKACARKKVDEHLKITTLHSWLAEHESQYIEEACQHMARRDKTTKTAIWGSGPAAMMAAWNLIRSGHQAVLLEPEEESGGALREIASLSPRHQKTVKQLQGLLRAAGIETITNAALPVFSEVLAGHDALFITYQNERGLWEVLERNHIDKASWEVDPLTLEAAGSKNILAGRDFSPGGLELAAGLAVGQTAFESIKRLLSGTPLWWERDVWQSRGCVKEYRVAYERARHVAPKESGSSQLEADGPADNSAEIITPEQAVYEAERCLACGRPFDHNQTCWYCLPCEIECPHGAIEVQIPYLLR